MLPQAAVGGEMPIPIKLRVASIKMAVPMFKVIRTSREGKALGNRWRSMMTESGAKWWDRVKDYVPHA